MGLKSFIKTLAIGAGAGAAAVWFNDPERGQQRRERFMQRATSTVGEARGVIEQARDQIQDAEEEVHDRADDEQGQPGQATTVDLVEDQSTP